jgi:hypothetical protein
MRLHENTTLLLESLGLGQGEKINVDRVFKKSNRETIGFEVTFTALIATLVLSVPSTGTLIDPVGKLAAIFLLSVTLARRLALDNPFIDKGRFFDRTTGYILYLTIVGVVYISLSLSDLIAPYTPLGVYVTTGCMILAASVMGLLIYEVVFRDFLLFAAVVFYNYQINQPNTSSFYNGVLSISRLALRISSYEYDEEDSVIARIDKRDLGSTQSSFQIYTFSIFFFTALLILVIGIFIAIIASYAVGRRVVPAVIVVIVSHIGTIPLSAVVQFVYARYGNTSFQRASDLIQAHKTLPLIIFLLILHFGPSQLFF